MTEMPPSPTKVVADTSAPSEARRKVPFLLGLGILFVPFVFVWFLLRKGHSTLSRVIGFLWFGFAVLIAVVPKAPDGASASKPAASAPALSPEEIKKAEEDAKAVAVAEAAEAAEREVKRHPERSLSFDTISGQKGGFETVLMLNGAIKNNSAHAMKDVEIQCTLSGPSGTKVGSVRETLYEIIPAQGAKRFRDLNMGFMGSTQVANFNCEIVRATLVGP